MKAFQLWVSTEGTLRLAGTLTGSSEGAASTVTGALCISPLEQEKVGGKQTQKNSCVYKQCFL